MHPRGGLPRGGFFSPSQSVKQQDGEKGFQCYLADKSLFAFLRKCDTDLAEICRQAGCLQCSGTLHRADYERKPRGGPEADPKDPAVVYRDSFCCATEGCRKRHTPPSVFGSTPQADITDKKAPLFRSALPRKKQLTQTAMSENDMHRMFKRRIRAAGLSEHLSPHSFRVTTITELLKQEVALEDMQNLAGHADPRTTRLYDRRKRKITRNIVERVPYTLRLRGGLGMRGIPDHLRSLRKHSFVQRIKSRLRDLRYVLPQFSMNLCFIRAIPPRRRCGAASPTFVKSYGWSFTVTFDASNPGLANSDVTLNLCLTDRVTFCVFL